MSEGAVVAVTREPGMEDLPLPSYATQGAAGMDLRAAVDGEIVLAPGARLLVPTGIRIALPEGTEAQIRPRSGLALHHGIALLNSPGTIDSDFRGPVCVILVNMGQQPFAVKRGDRIAQMVVAPVLRVCWQETNTLPPAVRGDGGFGHTGTD